MPERPPSRPSAPAAKLGALLAASVVSLLAASAAADPLPTTALEPVTLDLGIRLGPSVRVGDASALTIADRAGLAIGVGVLVTPTPRFSLGLAFEHVGLGREVAGDGRLGQVDYVDASRSLNALWADLRLHLFRTPAVRLSVLLGVGANWQSADVSAVISQDVGQPLLTVQCSGSDSMNFSFRAGLGAEFIVGNGFSFLLDAVGDVVRLSTDPLDQCVLGAGTMTLLSARAGLGYKFDVTRFVR